MAVARVDGLSFSYGGSPRPALRDVSLAIEPGQVVAVLGRSGCGKTTLLRALAGLVPHFHGGRFSGRVEVDGRDTRRTRPCDLASVVGILFQDPEDQVVLGSVLAEVAFGLENLGLAPALIEPRARAALARVGAAHLAERATAQLSAGELQRVCLAAVLASQPRILLLDEPSSQLDAAGAASLLSLLRGMAADEGVAVLVAEQRPAGPLSVADRVVVLEEGGIVLDAARDEAVRWLRRHRPEWLHPQPPCRRRSPGGEAVARLEEVGFSYSGRRVLSAVNLVLRRGEIVALTGPNGAGKTTLAKIAAGLLDPQEGRVVRAGRAAYLGQDPGRYLVCERAEDEVALAVSGDRLSARAALASVGLAGLEGRHPRDLSSGERERLALACVLVTDPDLLVLDEPTRGVDPPARRELARRLRAGAAGRATLVVTHDADLAAAVADRTVVLSPEDGRVAA